MHGPNVRKLICQHMSVVLYPPGSNGNIQSAVDIFKDKSKLVSMACDSTKWVYEQIEKIRNSTGDNPWKDKSDEVIAAEILRLVEEMENKESH